MILKIIYYGTGSLVVLLIMVVELIFSDVKCMASLNTVHDPIWGDRFGSMSPKK